MRGIHWNIFQQITRALSTGKYSNVYRVCSFFINFDLFCVDNTRVIYRKIWKLIFPCSFNNTSST
jgi:hypothetical protein